MKRFMMLMAALAVVRGASGASFFYDSFSYAPSSRLDGVSSSNAWSSYGVAPQPSNCMGSLVYSGLPDSPGGKVQLSGYKIAASLGGASRELWHGDGDAPADTNLFASFILRVESVGLIQSNQFVFSLRNGIRSFVSITNNANVTTNFDLLLHNTITGAKVTHSNGGDGFYPNVNYLIVLSYTNANGTAWGSQLWINPALGLPTPPSAQAGLSATSNGATNQYLLIGCANGNSSPGTVVFIDEMRCGTTWTDVTPSGGPPPPEQPTLFILE